MERKKEWSVQARIERNYDYSDMINQLAEDEEKPLSTDEIREIVLEDILTHDWHSSRDDITITVREVEEFYHTIVEKVRGVRAGQDVHLEPGSVPDSDQLILTDSQGYRYKRHIDPDLQVWRFKRL